MPRHCSICTHTKRKKIETSLAQGVSYRKIAGQFEASSAAVARHATGCMVSNSVAVEKARAKKITEVEAERVDVEVRSALSIEDELQRCFTRMNLIFDACDSWLRDPNDLTKYTLDPRSDEVSVTYLELGQNDAPIRKTENLHTLLARAGISPESWETKAADPRVLILKTAEQLGRQIDLLAKLRGEYKPDANAPVTVQLTQLIQIVNQYQP